MRKLLLVFGHKTATLVRQQSQGILEAVQLPGPQVMITMHPDGGSGVASRWQGDIFGWLAPAGLLDLGFSGLSGERKKSLSS